MDGSLFFSVQILHLRDNVCAKYFGASSRRFTARQGRCRVRTLSADVKSEYIAVHCAVFTVAGIYTRLPLLWKPGKAMGKMIREKSRLIRKAGKGEGIFLVREVCLLTTRNSIFNVL